MVFRRFGSLANKSLKFVPFTSPPAALIKSWRTGVGIEVVLEKKIE
jgi:hypothetical protein